MSEPWRCQSVTIMGTKSRDSAWQYPPQRAILRLPPTEASPPPLISDGYPRVSHLQVGQSCHPCRPYRCHPGDHQPACPRCPRRGQSPRGPLDRAVQQDDGGDRQEAVPRCAEEPRRPGKESREHGASHAGDRLLPSGPHLLLNEGLGEGRHRTEHLPDEIPRRHGQDY